MVIDANDINECLRIRRNYYDKYTKSYSFRGQDKVSIRQDGQYIVWSLWGCEIYLNSDGTWFVSDTSGG